MKLSTVEAIVLAIFGIIGCRQLRVVDASGMFEFQIELVNDLVTKTATLFCCRTDNSTSMTANCSEACNLNLEVCLGDDVRRHRHYQLGRCEIGQFTIRFAHLVGKESHFKVNGTIPFKNPWMSTSVISVRFIRNSTRSSDPNMIVLRQFSWNDNQLIADKQNWTVKRIGPSQTSRASSTTGVAVSQVLLQQKSIVDSWRFQVSYRIRCDDHFFGSRCEVYCRRQDDQFGHFKCDPTTGKRRCLPGWQGDYCRQAICRKKCNHGSCVQPDTCECYPGWQGPTCEHCLLYPGCQHGVCEVDQTSSSPIPFTCDCLSGWGGMLCDIDVYFCQKNPDFCRNGGHCENVHNRSKVTHHQCRCQPGYSGGRCELEVRPGDCRLTGCSGSGECHSRRRGDGSGQFRCRCQAGYFGDQCQYQRIDTAFYPCQLRGAQCFATTPSEIPYVCLCDGVPRGNVYKNVSCPLNTCPKGYSCGTVEPDTSCKCSSKTGPSKTNTSASVCFRIPHVSVNRTEDASGSPPADRNLTTISGDSPPCHFQSLYYRNDGLAHTGFVSASWLTTVLIALLCLATVIISCLIAGHKWKYLALPANSPANNDVAFPGLPLHLPFVRAKNEFDEVISGGVSVFPLSETSSTTTFCPPMHCSDVSPAAYYQNPRHSTKLRDSLVDELADCACKKSLSGYFDKALEAMREPVDLRPTAEKQDSTFGIWQINTVTDIPDRQKPKQPLVLIDSSTRPFSNNDLR